MENTKNYLFADVGNTATDMIFTDFKTFVHSKVGSKDKLGIRRELNKYVSSYPNLEVYVSSVDSVGLKILTHQLKELGLSIFVLTPSRMAQFCKKNKYKVSNVSFLGSDLFCDIVSRDSANGLIVVDLGTASKILYIDSNKNFKGGQIFPGLLSGPAILSQKTDLLKNFEIQENPPLLSLKTETSISSGIINGTAGLVKSMVEAIKKEYDDPNCQVLLSGGNSRYIKKELSRLGLSDFETDKNCVTEGLARIYGFESYSLFKETF
jgi:type III pantothenate kinase